MCYRGWDFKLGTIILVQTPRLEVIGPEVGPAIVILINDHVIKILYSLGLLSALVRDASFCCGQQSKQRLIIGQGAENKRISVQILTQTLLPALT